MAANGLFGLDTAPTSETLKSAITNTLFPFNSRELKSLTLFIAIETTRLAPLPLTAVALEATLRERSVSVEEKARRHTRRDRDRWMNERQVEEVEEVLVDGRRESIVCDVD
ncbi:unnamed protein product [Lupinus luteus]|uniref:Uncharacterized protein n=1 Tax=Lupinus luteus TaxID=3873 RepID=A0AAV1WND8_LUPLU